MSVKYLNPPLVEAIVEIFYVSDNWTPAIPGLIYNVIREDFPIISQSQSGGFEFAIGNQGIRFGNNNMTSRFTTADEKTIVQVSPEMLTINKLPPYNNWENYLPIIENLLNQLQNIIKFQRVTRIGLRYINKVNIGDHHSYENYKNHINLIPDGVKDLTDDFNSLQLTIEQPKDDGDIRVVNISTLRPEPKMAAPVLVQLGYVNTIQKMYDKDAFKKWLNEKAHPNMNLLFERIFTKSCKKKFN